MKREGLAGLRGCTAVLRAVFLALSALCTSALAQAGPATPPSTGCIPLSEANNTMTPPSLYGGVAQCVANGDYDAAARLFALAGIYLHFDAARVADPSAAGVAGALPMLASNGASPEQKEKLLQGIDALRNDPARLKSVCSDIARIGRPGYYPQYMLASGMGAFIGEPKGGPLKPNFDAAATWNKLQATYLECPSGEGAAPQSPGLMAKIFGTHSAGAHMNDVAEKIAEWPDAGSGSVPFNPVFSPDGSVLASYDTYRENGQWNWKIAIWDWRNRRLLRRMDVLGNPALAYEPLTFSPDGRFLALCADGGEHDTAVRVWNAATWQVAADVVDSYSNGCTAIAFSADSHMLLRINNYVRSGADYLYVYSTADWQKLWSLHDERIDFSADTLAVSPTGHLAAIGGSHFVKLGGPEPGGPFRIDPKVGVLDLQQKKIVRVITLPGIPMMSWSPDGAKLAMVGGDLEILDPLSGQRLVQKQVEPSHVSLQYSPDGRYLVLGGYMPSTGLFPGFGVQIWDSQVDRLLQRIPGNAAGIAISRDSRYLAIAQDGRIQIWQFK